MPNTFHIKRVVQACITLTLWLLSGTARAWVTVEPRVAPPAGTVTVMGSHFRPASPMEVFLKWRRCSVSTDTTGHFSCTFKVPKSLEPGDRNIWTVNRANGRWIRTPLKVLDPEGSLAPAEVPRTGQTASYNQGDDGALQKGLAWPKPRFIKLVNTIDDNGVGEGVAGNAICDGTEICNGTVKDQLTGLVWLANANCFGPQKWDDALYSANTLISGKCGLSDGSKPGEWGLPNLNELHSLTSFHCQYPALSDRIGDNCFDPYNDPFFSNVAFEHVGFVGYYWSSTTESSFSPLFHWAVDFRLGQDEKFSSERIHGGFKLLAWPVKR